MYDRERTSAPPALDTGEAAIEEAPRGNSTFGTHGPVPAVSTGVPSARAPSATERAYGETARMTLFSPATAAAGRDDNDTKIDPHAHIAHCIAKLNEYRAKAPVPAPPLVELPELSKFALVGSQAREDGGIAHDHIRQATEAGTVPGMAGKEKCRGDFENQGFVSGTDIDAIVDKILALMMAEGPGGGHHDNILNPTFQYVGVGILVGQLRGIPGVWLTTDFLSTCRA